jgi:hypothetical protein
VNIVNRYPHLAGMGYYEIEYYLQDIYFSILISPGEAYPDAGSRRSTVLI